MGRKAEGYKLVQRENGFWYIYHPGSRRFSSTGEKDRGIAEKVLALVILETKAPEPDALPLAYVLERYKQDKASTPSANNIKYHIPIIIAFLGDITVSGIHPSGMRETVQKMQDSGHSDGYIRRILATLIAALNHARKDGLLTNVPFIAMPPMPQSKERWLDRAEAARLLEEAHTPHLKRFIMLALHTGQRIGAILDLSWGQVDIDRKRIDFNPPGRVQTNKRRAVVPINDDLLAELEGEEHQSGYVVQFKGKQIKKVQNAFGKACTRAGLDDVTPHTLRHTCGTWLAQAGVDMWMISGILGHGHSRTTELYLKHSPDHLRAAVNKLQTNPGKTPRKGRN